MVWTRSEWIKCFSPLCNIRHVMPDLQTEYGSASAFCYRQNMFLAYIWEAALLWMFSACFNDMRLDSCMSDSLSFVNKSNLCLILSSSSSKISDNQSGLHWGWKNHHAGIHICTICDGDSCVVIDQSHTLKHTHKHIGYTNTNDNIYTDTIIFFFSVSHSLHAYEKALLLWVISHTNKHTHIHSCIPRL